MNRLELESKSDRELLILAVQRVNDLCDTVVIQGNRISSLEHWRWAISGGVAILVFTLPLVTAWLVRMVK